MNYAVDHALTSAMLPRPRPGRGVESNFPPPARRVEGRSRVSLSPRVRPPRRRAPSTPRRVPRATSSSTAPLSLGPDAARPDRPRRPQPRPIASPRRLPRRALSRRAVAVSASRCRRRRAKSDAESRRSQHPVEIFWGARRPAAPSVRRPWRQGAFYCAMVGPFATREQAVQLCSSLKWPAAVRCASQLIWLMFWPAGRLDPAARRT